MQKCKSRDTEQKIPIFTKNFRVNYAIKIIYLNNTIVNVALNHEESIYLNVCTGRTQSDE